MGAILTRERIAEIIRSYFPECGPVPIGKAFPDVSSVQLWRWRKRKWLPTINICGRQYVTREAIAEFNRRASAGEFAQEHKTPSRK